MRAVDLVVQHFPQSRGLIRRLYLSDQRFHAICEDFALSVTSLRHFESRPDAASRPEVSDYRTLLRELEEEMRRHIEAAEAASPPPPRS